MCCVVIIILNHYLIDSYIIFAFKEGLSLQEQVRKNTLKRWKVNILYKSK